jgi:rhamnose transport system permease protein
MIPRSISNPYFVSCREGAEEAARELDIGLLWDGPEQGDADRQSQVLEGVAAKGVSVIAVSAIAPTVLKSLRRLRQSGVKVLT